jgi:DNA-binding MarR family transcriptional regulator
MKEEKIKEAFERVKQDIFDLGYFLQDIKLEIIDLKQKISQLNQKIEASAHNEEISTSNLASSTNQHIPADNSAHFLALESLKSQNKESSTGNGGVPADRQTIQQTDKQDKRFVQSRVATIETKDHTKEISEIMSKLKDIKEETKQKFKALTPQEFLVFSTIYALEETGPVDYQKMAQKLNLTQSSIRDYIQRLLKKGIPLIKDKVSNKKILVKLSPELRQIATLETLIKLREI